MILPTSFHFPVLLPQVIGGLKIEAGKKYIDATLGGGGYTAEILKRGGIVLGIDADEDALNYVGQKCKVQPDSIGTKFKVFLEQGNFSDLKKIAEKYGFNQVAGIVFDLGMSSYQLEQSRRGFSYKESSPLDMRMDRKQTLTAADIINKFTREELYEIFTKFAEEVHSRTIVSAILSARTLEGHIKTTDRLVAIIDQVLGRFYASKNYHQFNKIRNQILARCFQALRIAVNNELVNLKEGLTEAIDLLEVEGRLVVLSYHSLEDRLVKLKLKESARTGVLAVITKKPIIATKEEIAANSKSHSVKLRIAEKL